MRYALAAIAVLTVGFVGWRIVFRIRYDTERGYRRAQEYLHPSSCYKGKKG